MSIPFFVGSYFQVTWLAIGQGKGRKILHRMINGVYVYALIDMLTDSGKVLIWLLRRTERSREQLTSKWTIDFI